MSGSAAHKTDADAPVIGVLGGGQLARMLALAAIPLGLRVRCWDVSADAPAACVSELLVGDFGDEPTLARFAAGLLAATFEFENIPAGLARAIAARVATRPGPLALETGQDRIAEKTLLARLGVPVHAFACIDSMADLDAAIEGVVGLPCVIKTRRMGYDGKGQGVARTRDEAVALVHTLGGNGLIAERFVPFERELSMICVRGATGEVRTYPLIENRHAGGILRVSRAPAKGVSAQVGAAAANYAKRILDALEYVGVLTIEFFETREGLLANEIAPRVHNSGHWTIEGAVTSQFENHVRAVAGLPLGACDARESSAMVNLIGEIPPREAVLAIPGARLHLYDKPPRPGRKVGHVTITADACADLDAAVEAVRKLPGATG